MLRLFGLCEATRWTHLPVAGGLYDQDPDFLDALEYMLQKKGEVEERKAKREEQENARKRPSKRR